MRIVNDTPFPVHAVPGYGPDDGTILTLLLKGTFEIVPDGAARPADQPEPIAFADDVVDTPRGPLPRLESDVAPFKPRADVLALGRALAPRGRPVQQLDVRLRFGAVDKTVRVFGAREWKPGGLGRDPKISEPKAFTECELSYAQAFGGLDAKRGGTFLENPVGIGFIAEKTKHGDIEGRPLPRIEDPAHPIASWKDRPHPAGLGAIGRGWAPRSGRLGTYDERWQKDRSPRPPRDFSFAFYNAAPADQQARGYLAGDEPFEIVNATAAGRLAGRLPAVLPIVSLRRTRGSGGEEVAMNLDTAVLDVERMRLLLVWRGTPAIPAIEMPGVAEVRFRLRGR